MTHSPWLFVTQKKFTVVDKVYLKFYDTDGEKIEEFCMKLEAAFPGCLDRKTMTITAGKDRYRWQEDECRFNFDWEDLTMYVTNLGEDKMNAYFADRQERTSRCVWRDDGPDFAFETIESHIPWLQCVS